jgi:hypothetical protein
MSLESLELILGVFYGLVTLWGVLDAINRPRMAWQRVGHYRITWILIQILLPFGGTILYFLMVRWRLRDAGRPGYES